MKILFNVLMATVLWVMFFPSFAQEQTPGREFLMGPHSSVSGFGSFYVDFTEVNDDLMVFPGIGGGVIFGQTLFTGIYATGSYGNANVAVSNYDNPKLIVGHSGLWAGFLIDSDQLVHAGISAKIGWGPVLLMDIDYDNI